MSFPSSLSLNTPEYTKYWNNANVTRIHGEWYDVTKLDHPGGIVALELSFGRDSTILFHSHHPFVERKKLASWLQNCAITCQDTQRYLDRLYPDACIKTEYDFDFRAAAAELGIIISFPSSTSGGGGDTEKVTSPDDVSRSIFSSSSTSTTTGPTTTLEEGSNDLRNRRNGTNNQNNHNDNMTTKSSRNNNHSSNKANPILPNNKPSIIITASTGATSSFSPSSSPSPSSSSSHGSRSGNTSDEEGEEANEDRRKRHSDEEYGHSITDDASKVTYNTSHNDKKKEESKNQKTDDDTTTRLHTSSSSSTRTRSASSSTNTSTNSEGSGGSGGSHRTKHSEASSTSMESETVNDREYTTKESSTFGTKEHFDSILKKRNIPSTTTTTTITNANTSTTSVTTDPFEVEVKSIFLTYFQQEMIRRNVPLREAMKAPPIRWAQVCGLGLLFLFCGIYPLVQGWWFSLLLTPTLGWIYMVNHWHDAAHFAMSSRWYVNAALTYFSPWFSSPLIWYHQHVIGHHAYTNVPGKDPDLYHAPKFWRFHSSLRWTPLHRYQRYTTFPLLWLASVPTLLFVKPFVALQSKMYNRAVTLMKVSKLRALAHIVGRILVASSVYVWPWFVFKHDIANGGGTDMWKAAAFAFVPLSIYSLWFMACSQVNHHSDETSEAWSPNWYRHQVMTSHSVAPLSSLAFWLSGGLNLQIEHHLFPAVNHYHLPYLQPQIEAAAKKHGVHYTKSDTIPEAFYKLWQHLDLLATKTPASSPKAGKTH